MHYTSGHAVWLPLSLIVNLLILLGTSAKVEALNGAIKSTRFIFHSQAGGGERSYLLHLPVQHKESKPSPLLLVFHGKQQSGDTIEKESSFSDPAWNKNAIVVYPQGIKEQWNGDPEAPPLSEINDVEMVSDLIDHLESEYTIDKTRIYAFGFSNGGGLTDLLACSVKLSQRIAAFGATSFAVYKDSALKEPLFSNCPSRRAPIPFLEFHGTADPVIHYDGKTTPDGQTYPLARRMQEWAERNGCGLNAANSTTQLYQGKVQRYSWDCQEHKDVVVHYRIEGFGHGFPTTTPLDNDEQRHGPTYFNATPLILEFFHKWVLPAGIMGHERDEL